MKKVIYIWLVILLVIAGCGGDKQSMDDCITVDVTKSYPKKELILQDIFDIEYIPLETVDEFTSSVLVQTIGKEVVVVKNNANDGNILFFDRKSGKGLRIMNRRGQGNEEYLNVSGVILDQNNNEIYVNSVASRKIYVYDLEGNFKRVLNHKEGIWYDQIDHFDQNSFICHDGSRMFDNTPKNIFWIISKQDGSVIKEIQIPYKERILTTLTKTDGLMTAGSGAGNRELVPFQDRWLLMEPSSDTIYKTLPDYSVAPFIARIPSIQSMTPEIFLFPGVLTDQYYFMQTVKKEYDFNTRTGWPSIDIVYDKQNNTIFEYMAYNNDFSNKASMSLGSNGITFVNNEVAFIHKYEAYDLIEAYENGQLKGRLKDIAATLDTEDNPVLMLAKHKK